MVNLNKLMVLVLLLGVEDVVKRFNNKVKQQSSCEVYVINFFRCNGLMDGPLFCLFSLSAPVLLKSSKRNTIAILN